MRGTQQVRDRTVNAPYVGSNPTHAAKSFMILVLLSFIASAHAQVFDWRATRATVTTSANVLLASVVIIPANLNRRCLYIYNNSANSAYITFGPTSSSATPTSIIATFTSFVMAAGQVYTGQISAIRNAGNGTMTITECMP